jgi:cell division protein ZapA
MERSTSVEIFNQIYAIRGDDPEKIKALAEIVDKKMKEVSQFSRIADTNKIAILAALSIADEYLECCNDLSLLQERLHNHCEFVKENLDELIISK